MEHECRHFYIKLVNIHQNSEHLSITEYLNKYKYYIQNISFLSLLFYHTQIASKNILLKHTTPLISMLNIIFSHMAYNPYVIYNDMDLIRAKTNILPYGRLTPTTISQVTSRE